MRFKGLGLGCQKSTLDPMSGRTLAGSDSAKLKCVMLSLS